MTAPLPIVFLHTSDKQGISGAIRFQKLVFLGQEESNLPDHYRFIPYKFGPYSYQLNRDIEAGIRNGHIRRNRNQNEVGHYRIDYSLTPDGIRLAKALLEKEGFDKIFEEADIVTSEHGEKSLSTLLKYVYRKYPEYSDESTLDINRIFDESTTSQFVESDPSQVGPFDQIRKLNEEEGEIAGIGNGFIRQSIEVGSEFQATIERISGDSVSIYWNSNISSFDSFAQVVQDDRTISDDAPSEMRTRESEDWIRGEFAELVSICDSHTCLFFRTEAEGQYTVTWEAGLDDDDEITIYVAESQVDYEKLRAALVHYATATALDTDIGLRGQFRTTDDLLSESLRQTAKLAIS